VVCSRARADHPADEWSDLDIILAAAHRERYLENTAWLNEIAPVLICMPGRTSSSDPELLLLFQGGECVDVVFNTDEELRQAAAAHYVPDVFRRGARILLDKDDLARQIVPAQPEPVKVAPPSPDEFAKAVEAFWYSTYYLAKQLQRGDLWMFQRRANHLQETIVQMMGWHAQAMRPERDIWHQGRFMAEWADPRALEALPCIFARWDAADCWRSLSEMMALFRWLARETALRLDCAYPDAADKGVSALVESLMRGVG